MASSLAPGDSASLAMILLLSALFLD